MKKERLFDLLKAAASQYECAAYVINELVNDGFELISFSDAWELKPGGRYVINHHDTTVFAFTVGCDYKTGDMLRIAAAHTDYPCLRIKPAPDFTTNVYAQVNVEVYGGPILNTWYDRPLGVAGRVAIKSEDAFKPKMVLYKSKKPLMIVPNLAIHMNREVNNGVAINNQKDLMPIVDVLQENEKTTDYFISFIASELGIDKDEILDFELNTYCMDEPVLVGISDSMISSPRIDNQSSCEALLYGIENASRTDGINVIALFDHEEIGSSSKQGAASILLREMIKRILRTLGADSEQSERAMYDAMLLSVDVAHALHPNNIEKMDITNRPVMGAGICIKEACSQSYATDAEAVAILCQICEKNNIPYQRFVNRSDIRGGGTLGSIASTLLPVKTVDIGIPILAMHSASELMGTTDIDALCDCLKAYFS